MKYMSKKNCLVRALAIAFSVILLMMVCTCCVQRSEASTEGTGGSTQSTVSTSTGTTAPSGSVADSTEPTVPDGTGAGEDDPDHTHTYAVYSIRYPSCTDEGYTVYHCDCGTSYQGDETPVLSHNYFATVVEPTYTAQGYTEHICSMCQDSYKDSYVDKLVAPVVPGHTHTYVDTVVKPTCGEEGYTLRTCSCGHSYQDTVVEAKGHTMSTTVVNVTCTQAGYTKNTCSVCGHSYTYNNTPAAGHSYGDWVTVKEATETEQGQLKRTCSTCGDVNTQVVPVIGEVRESYIDPRIEVRIVGRNQNRNYTYGNVGVTDKSSWDNSLSIYITDAGGFYITYYLQDGTKVEYTLAPPSEEYIRSFIIKTDGTYLVGLIGDFSD